MSNKLNNKFAIKCEMQNNFLIILTINHLEKSTNLNNQILKCKNMKVVMTKITLIYSQNIKKNAKPWMMSIIKKSKKCTLQSFALIFINYNSRPH